ncbi:kruppel-like factor 11a [Stylonychia lemnae]|uniref:Kruppel-like factor 11a n=1 Tax=Stylonychia lemnae TaxID=5949 RepID=A0A078ALV4_STYLE|nr:kruppel-like factor 11a [Stylonychia lemnae]|eukprot:CDW83209.1 kruppel-like factor 11a [Stylonychia lemnae]
MQLDNSQFPNQLDPQRLLFQQLQPYSEDQIQFPQQPDRVQNVLLMQDLLEQNYQPFKNTQMMTAGIKIIESAKNTFFEAQNSTQKQVNTISIFIEEIFHKSIPNQTIDESSQKNDSIGQSLNKCSCQCQCSANAGNISPNQRQVVQIQTGTSDKQIQTLENSMNNDEKTLTKEIQIKRKLKLPDQQKIVFYKGEDLEPEQIPRAQHVPKLKTFIFVKIFQESSKRWKSMFICTFDHCDIVLKKWGNIFDHLRIHNREKPFTCPVQYCSRSFSQKSNLDKHFRMHQQLKLSCSECKKLYPRLKIMKHFLKNHSKEVKFIDDGENLDEEISDQDQQIFDQQLESLNVSKQNEAQNQS